jgi:hypothetical protein
MRQRVLRRCLLRSGLILVRYLRGRMELLCYREVDDGCAYSPDYGNGQ